MKKHHYFLSIILVCIIILLIRFVSITIYSPEPTLYQGGSNASLNYVIETGHIITYEESERIVSGNIFSQGMNEFANYPFLPSFYATLSIITDFAPSTWSFLFVKSIAFMVPLSLIFICLYYSLKNKYINIYKIKNFDEKNDYHSIIIILAFSQLAFPVTIEQNGDLGHLFMLIPIFILFFNWKSDVRLIAISLIMLLCAPIVYFTSVSFFILWMSIITLYLLYTRNKSSIPRFFIILVIAYLSYSIYVATTRSSEVIFIFNNFLDIIKNGFNQVETSSITLPSEYQYATSLINKIRYLISTILVCIPLIWFLLTLKRNKNNIILKTPLILIYSGIVAIPFFLVLLVSWLGVSSVGRLPEYVVLISTLATIFLIAVSDKKIRRYIVVISIICIISSSVTYLMDENTPFRRLTYNEQESSQWLMDHSKFDDIIFTDHRIAGTFVSNGYFNTTGITESGSSNFTVYELNSVYYKGTPESAFTIFNKYNAEYIFLSENMIKNSPAIFIYNYPIKPANQSFSNNIIMSNDINNLYSGAGNWVFSLCES